jgi:hypothetical protein
MHRTTLTPLCRRLAHLHSNRPKRLQSTKKPAEKDLKWTEREEAPKWMRKMAPPKGGTAPPTAKEFAVIAVVAAAFYYAWFIDPPKPAEE